MNEPNWALLLGAGFSAEAGVPTTRPMIKRFLQTLPAGARGYAQGIIERLPEERRDVEGLLEALEMLGTPATLAWRFARPPSQFRNAKRAQAVRGRLRSYIREVCTPPPDQVNYVHDLLQAVEAQGPIAMFSFNYDSCVEIACQTMGLTYDTGFAGEWRSAPTSESSNLSASVQLFKLHGSVLWFRSGATIWELPLAQVPGDPRTITGARLEPVILYPGDKERLHLPPLSALHERWRSLLAGHVRLLISIGYSFRDEYICDVIEHWLLPADRLLVAIDNDPAVLHDVRRRFGNRTICLCLPASQVAQTLIYDPNTQTHILPYLRSAPGNLAEYAMNLRDPNARTGTWPNVANSVTLWIKAGLLDLVLPVLVAALGTETGRAVSSQLDAFSAAWALAWARLRQCQALVPDIERRGAEAVKELPALYVSPDGQSGLVPSLSTFSPGPRLSDALTPLLADDANTLVYLNAIEAIRAIFRALSHWNHKGNAQEALPEEARSIVVAGVRALETCGVLRLGNSTPQGGVDVSDMVDVRASLLTLHDQYNATYVRKPT